MLFNRIVMLALGISTLIGLAIGSSGCQNAIPTVTKMGSVPGLNIVPAKDSRNFLQINAASHKQEWSDAASGGVYKGSLRVSQPLAELSGATPSGYHIKGTVVLTK